MRRTALLLAASALLAGCGGHKPDTYTAANAALLMTVPVFPGAAAPRTTASGAGGTKFAARDWTLPAGTRAEPVITWYIHRLQRAGWTIIGADSRTLRASRRAATLSVGVRGRTLEAIANARGVSLVVLTAR